MTDLITVAMIAGLAMPPQRYVHEPANPPRIEMVSPDRLIDICSQTEGKWVLGCYLDWYGNTIYLRNDMTDDAAQLVLRHEIAHVNGWEHAR